MEKNDIVPSPLKKVRSKRVIGGNYGAHRGFQTKVKVLKLKFTPEILIHLLDKDKLEQLEEQWDDERFEAGATKEEFV